MQLPSIKSKGLSPWLPCELVTLFHYEIMSKCLHHMWCDIIKLHYIWMRISLSKSISRKSIFRKVLIKEDFRGVRKLERRVQLQGCNGRRRPHGGGFLERTWVLWLRAVTTTKGTEGINTLMSLSPPHPLPPVQASCWLNPPGHWRAREPLIWVSPLTESRRRKSRRQIWKIICQRKSCPQHAEVPGPGIKPAPQQWPESQQWQCQILND